MKEYQFNMKTYQFDSEKYHTGIKNTIVLYKFDINQVFKTPS